LAIPKASSISSAGRQRWTWLLRRTAKVQDEPVLTERQPELRVTVDREEKVAIAPSEDKFDPAANAKDCRPSSRLTWTSTIASAFSLLKRTDQPIGVFFRLLSDRLLTELFIITLG